MRVALVKFASLARIGKLWAEYDAVLAYDSDTVYIVKSIDEEFVLEEVKSNV